MKPPIETIRGQISNYDHRRGLLTIHAYYPDWQTFARREYRECEIRLTDSRIISEAQRRSIYAMLGEIADYSGMDRGETKEIMKRKYLDDLGEPEDETFSLRNCPVSLASGFQRYLVRFMVDFEVPCHVSLLKYVDDLQDYLYACLMGRKCCVCGKKSDLHHLDAVGMGNNRKEIVHEGMRVLPLCRIHHSEIHVTGGPAFMEKYHLEGGIRLDRFLCQLYGLHTKEDL